MIAFLEGCLAEREFAHRLRLLMLEGTGDAQCLFQVLARLRVVADVDLDLPQVDESDGLTDTMAELLQNL